MNNTTKSRMYEIGDTRVKTWNPFVGCDFKCDYCYGPAIYQRFSKCERCKTFTPHFHPERLHQKFKAGETVFVCSMGDISFATILQWKLIFHAMRQYPKTTFLLQSKNPQQFVNFEQRYEYPFNCVLGTTIETNYTYYFNHYSTEKIVSKAPYPGDRKNAMVELHHRKYITIEPVLLFDVSILTKWLKDIMPEFVYVGYLNPLWKAKKLQLIEPPVEKTMQLIKALAPFTEVRLKTMRNPWNEKEV